ncbi:MAG: HEPN domain-containing protein [Chloroflexi bacterium]|nr:HEPN domain-containing protein [Chloroflexota bacterium]
MTRQEEVRAMLDKAQRYLKSAETLRQQQDYDSAVSRLYYAMFYVAEALLFAHGQSFSSHRAVISAFAQQFIKTKRLPPELHQWLREGFEKRQVSDYEFMTGTSDAVVVEMQTRASQFVNQVEALLKQEGAL